MQYDPNVYGYVNGKPTYSRDEFIFASRKRGPIEDDAELLEFAAKVTGQWYRAGWRRTFTTYHLGNYVLDEPFRSLTTKEYARLRELQQEAIAAEKAEDDARGWRLIQTDGYADNSVEKTYRDKDGTQKTVMAVAPHGDAS